MIIFAILKSIFWIVVFVVILLIAVVILGSAIIGGIAGFFNVLLGRTEDDKQK